MSLMRSRLPRRLAFDQLHPSPHNISGCGILSSLAHLDSFILRTLRPRVELWYAHWRFAMGEM